MTHGGVRAQTTGTLDHLENEEMAVSETDKKLWIAGRWVHALQQTFKRLGVCVRVCVCVCACDILKNIVGPPFLFSPILHPYLPSHPPSIPPTPLPSHLLQECNNILMVLCDAQLHGHLKEGAHHEDVGVVGRGQCCP